MSFFSTRGNACVTASQAVLYGLAGDGGLYVPAMFSPVDFEYFNHHIIGKSYAQITANIVNLFLEDFSQQEILRTCEKAYGDQFTSPDIAPLHALNDDDYVLELFHGPTASCKDISLQLLPGLIDLAAQKNSVNQSIISTVVTTGDTGAAALAGFKNMQNMHCAAFYPDRKSNLIPRLQMEQFKSSQLHTIGVKGSFATLTESLEEFLADEGLHQQLLEKNFFLTSANSINFGRLVSQIATYFVAYNNLLTDRKIAWGDPVHFVVPVGNFGNILAGFYARNMGLPVGKLICASNRNNALTSFFNSGIYSTNRLFFDTLSPALDVAFPKNLERLLYEITDRDGELVTQWMDLLKRTGSFSIGEQRMEWLSNLFISDSSNDFYTAKEIKRVLDRYDYLLDPHSAVASHVLYQYREKTGDATPAIILSTASPYKFPQEMLLALEPDKGVVTNPLAALRRLESYYSMPIPFSPELKSDYDITLSHSVEPAQMRELLSQMVSI